MTKRPPFKADSFEASEAKSMAQLAAMPSVKGEDENSRAIDRAACRMQLGAYYAVEKFLEETDHLRDGSIATGELRKIYQSGILGILSGLKMNIKRGDSVAEKAAALEFVLALTKAIGIELVALEAGMVKFDRSEVTVRNLTTGETSTQPAAQV